MRRIRDMILQRFSSWKISAKVSASTVFIVVLQGLISIIGMSVVIDRANRESFAAQLERTVHSVESLIDTTAADLTVKANLLGGQQKIIDFTDYGLSNLLVQELSVIRQPLKVDALCIVDTDGDLLGAVGEQKLIDAFTSKGLASNYWAGNSLFITPVSDQIHLWALTPIVRNKQKIGVLGVGLNLDSNFINRVEWMNNAAVLLSYRMQFFVSGTLPVSFFNQFVESIRSQDVRELSVPRSVGPRSYTSTFVVPNLPGLYVHCFIDTGDSRKLLGRYQTFSVAFLLVVIALSFTMSFGMYRYTFLRPFNHLRDAIKSISMGNLDHSIERMEKDEFGDLARAFEEMMKSLRERERELAELERYNSLVLSNVTSGIFTISYEGTVTPINAAACILLGLSPTEAGAVHALTEVRMPAGLPPFIEECLRAESPPAHVKEVKAELAGTVRTLTVSASPFISEHSAKLGIIVVVADVTHEKELEEKLEISSRMAAMGEMVAGVAHQIRNPLGVMKVSSEMLWEQLRELGAGEQQTKLISMIANEIDSLGAVVSNFLDFARPLSVKKEPCSVEELIHDVMGRLPTARYPGVSLHSSFAANLPHVMVDRGLIEQAFTNLMVNALQASVPGQSVLVDAWRADGHVVVEIRDFGHGMDEATRKKIFNPFFTTKADGTGLGLSIVHRIVDSHGGRIELSSEPGAGTTFKVYI